MRGFLLDTNVVSELAKRAPDPQVVAFLSSRDDLWLSTVVTYELEFGLRLLPVGRRRRQLEDALTAIVTEHQHRLLPVGRREARQGARLRAQAQLAGRTGSVSDSLIAGTAAVHDLAIATRNVSDFEGLGVDVVSPWTVL